MQAKERLNASRGGGWAGRSDGPWGGRPLEFSARDGPGGRGRADERGFRGPGAGPGRGWSNPASVFSRLGNAPNGSGALSRPLEAASPAEGQSDQVRCCPCFAMQTAACSMRCVPWVLQMHPFTVSTSEGHDACLQKATRRIMSAAVVVHSAEDEMQV